MLKRLALSIRVKRFYIKGSEISLFMSEYIVQTYELKPKLKGALEAFFLFTLTVFTAVSLTF